VAAVTAAPARAEELVRLPVFGGRSTRRHADTWFGALQGAARLAEAELPVPAPAGDGPPPANRWAERDPVAARRLARVRTVVTALAEQITMPPENLVQPEAVRRLAWTPPAEPTPDTVAAALRTSGARPWQIDRVAEPLAAALPDPPVGTSPPPSPTAEAAASAPAQPPPAAPATGEPAPPGPPPFSDS
jgi:ribonuclease D